MSMTNATFKIDLIVVEGEKNKNIKEVYDYLRESLYWQYRGLNLCASTYWSLRLSGKTTKETKDEMKAYVREPKSKLGSAYPDDFQFGKGLAMASNIFRKVSSDCENALKNGSKTVISYKAKNPILLPTPLTRLMEDNMKRVINNKPMPLYQGIYHQYKDNNELLEHIEKSDVDIYLAFTHNILFKFKISKNPYKDRPVKEMLKKVFTKEYNLCDSTINLVKNKDGKGDKIVLYLCVEIPIKERELDENTVVGIDLGVNVPMYCALNNNSYKRRYIGDGQMLIDHYSRYKKILAKFQKQSKYCKGGHGRKRKMRRVDNLKASQSAFTEKMVQKFAKEAVQFAITNNAKYINIEKLEDIDKNNKFLSEIHWPFHLMDQWIINQANKVGIIVRYVNPAYTSQTCSVCGSNVEGQRNGRVFKCNDPACKSHSMYVNKNGEEFFHADFNAARNIAMSTNFVENDKKKCKKSKNTSNNLSNETALI